MHGFTIAPQSFAHLVETACMIILKSLQHWISLATYDWSGSIESKCTIFFLSKMTVFPSHLSCTTMIVLILNSPYKDQNICF
ncbi:Os03g0448500 [Oryza sativa Japonica Group]|uniref:Os03g0448500 protein n=1 Tax=Oryza sativa subsp. japonica TaxID=39947 RepID=A0A0P0VZ52_ORYSJ|nr:hypothetical protein EE612_018351 [Oryza sativa]BAS84898.1 Os03g0448500 [Oryza sativa Japonica Group]